MVKDWEVTVIGEQLTLMLAKGIDVGTVSLLRRLVDDYSFLLTERESIKEELESLGTHLRSTTHPHRCPDCVHHVQKALVKVSRR